MELGYSQLGDMETDLPAEQETVMPSMTLRGEAAKQICAGCKEGDEFTAPVTFRVKSMMSGENPENPAEIAEVELEAVSMDYAQDGAAEGADAFDTYMAKRPAKGPPLDAEM